MGKAEKLLDKIKTSSKNVRFEELCKVIKNKGYDIMNIKRSHYSFSDGEETITKVKPHGGNKFCHILDVKEVIKQCLQ